MRIEIEIEKRFAYLNLDVGFWKRYRNLDGNYELDSNYETAQNVAGIHCYFRIEIPSFKPDKEHINWVKEAWGIVTADDKLKVEERIAYPCDEDYDPIPF